MLQYVLDVDSTHSYSSYAGKVFGDIMRLELQNRSSEISDDHLKSLCISKCNSSKRCLSDDIISLMDINSLFYIE